MAAQALQAKIDILWFKVQQEEVYNSVETDVNKKISRAENIANLYTELAQLIKTNRCNGHLLFLLKIR